jgi:N-methylhydantoinase A/oxoprolinase/acetone carboxylase beta subunit
MGGGLPVGVLRRALPATPAVPPLTAWPEDLVAAVGRNVALVAGGDEFDGRPIAPLDERAVAEAARGRAKPGLKTAAMTCVFSPMNGAMEARAAEIVRQEAPGVAVRLASELGQARLLSRENSTIINEALSGLAVCVVSAFRAALHDLGLDVPLFISQNDGTLMRVEEVERYPVLAFASGSTGSMRGAVHLAGIRDATVADIGDTTSDVGMPRRGFPRQSTHFVHVGGGRTKFRMPELLAVGLGDGPILREDGHGIGPDPGGYLPATPGALASRPSETCPSVERPRNSSCPTSTTSAPAPAFSAAAIRISAGAWSSSSCRRAARSRPSPPTRCRTTCW